MTKSRGLREHHGMRKNRVYSIWTSMRSRCLNPNHKAYANYGGRGIGVCFRWEMFSAFLDDMGHPPVGATLDRINNNEGYSASNCRWATRSEQGRNKRNNVLLTIDGETLPLAAWAERHGVSYSLAHQRLRLGWPPKLAVTTPRVTNRKGIPRGSRVEAWGAENGIVWSDPAFADEVASQHMRGAA